MFRLNANDVEIITHQDVPRSALHVCDDRNLTDATHRLSYHRTSAGTLVYYRCSCGRPRVGLFPGR
jgi:hypothetical protein